MYMYIYIYIYLYVNIYAYIYICIHTYVRLYRERERDIIRSKLWYAWWQRVLLLLCVSLYIECIFVYINIYTRTYICIYL